jgi:site-specific recombinase XerD
MAPSLLTVFTATNMFSTSCSISANRNAVVFVRDITADHLEAWLTSEVWASLKSLHARRSHGEKVRNFFRFCVRKLGLATVPHMDSVVVKNHAEAVRPFDKKEYERILAAIAKTSMTDENKTRIKAIMQLQRFSGLSLVDAVLLSKDQLQLGDGEYHVVRQRQKTKHAGITVNNVIPTWLGEELLRVKNGNPKYFFWSGTTTPEDAPSYFQKLYRRVFETAGIDGSSHDFRHTYAVELLKAGVNIRSVQKALGHASLQVTERFYAKWNQAQQSMLDDELRAALAKQK